MKKNVLVVGVDEAGRGPLAGDVFVCACAYFVKLPEGIIKAPLKLRDSKKLTEKARNEWFKFIKQEIKKKNLFISVQRETKKTIDKINIARAIDGAVDKAVSDVVRQSGIKKGVADCYYDGGLFAMCGRLPKNVLCRLTTTIKGDDYIPVISLASICAKVSRDAYMQKMHKKYPDYGFDRNKGYGTAEHIRAIKKFGKTKIHRNTFCRQFEDTRLREE